MKRFKFIDKLPPFLRNKYFITLIVFLIWLTFFDANNLISRVKEIRQLNKLKAEKEYYMNRIQSDSEKIRELETDNDNLEKFAREQFRMKKPDEDIYVIITPKEEKENVQETTPKRKKGWHK